MLHFIKTNTPYGELKVNLNHVVCANYTAETNQTEIVYDNGEVAKLTGREVFDKIPV